MKLNENHIGIITNKLSNVKIECSTCGHKELTLVDRVMEFREFNDGNLIIGGSSSVVPVILLMCKNCGEMKMFNAVVLGVIDNEEKTLNVDK